MASNKQFKADIIFWNVLEYNKEYLWKITVEKNTKTIYANFKKLKTYFNTLNYWSTTRYSELKCLIEYQVYY